MTNKIYDILPLDIKEMDIEHEELIKLLNELGGLVFNKVEDNNIICLLNKTIENTTEHFLNEEVLIRQFLNKEEAEAHINQHVLAIKTLINLKSVLELDLIKYQIKYRDSMSNFVSQVFNQDYLLSLRIKEKNKS